MDASLDDALLFANVRMVPYRLAVRCPTLPVVERFVSLFGKRLWIEAAGEPRFYIKGVGIWLLHRRLWHECRGYDQRLIYMGKMEENMVKRLMRKHPLVNFGEIVGYDFYHLEHYHPFARRKSSAHRKSNRDLAGVVVDDPNGSDWGLAEYAFETFPACAPSTGTAHTLNTAQGTSRFTFFGLLVMLGVQMALDRLYLLSRSAFRLVLRQSSVWLHRAAVLLRIVSERRIAEWPAAVSELRAARNGAHDGREKP